MPRPKKAYIIELPGGREVVMATLGVTEMQQSFELVGNVASDDARHFAEALEGMRLAIRKVDGKPVSRDALQGALWDDYFDAAETSLLAEQYGSIHAPTKAQRDQAGKKPVAENVSGG